MILNDKNAIERLNSPMNLINRLSAAKSNRNSAMSLFGIGHKEDKKKEEKEIEKIRSFNPFEHKELITPADTLENILENSESQIKLGLAHDRSLDLLGRSVEMLAAKLDDIKADKLPQVVTAASKVVESIRRERNEASKNNKDREVHYHFYVPEQKKVSDFEVIDVTS